MLNKYIMFSNKKRYTVVWLPYNAAWPCTHLVLHVADGVVAVPPQAGVARELHAPLPDHAGDLLLLAPLQTRRLRVEVAFWGTTSPISTRNDSNTSCTCMNDSCFRCRICRGKRLLSLSLFNYIYFFIPHVSGVDMSGEKGYFHFSYLIILIFLFNFSFTNACIWILEYVYASFC